jgi:hypothetical protein
LQTERRAELIGLKGIFVDDRGSRAPPTRVRWSTPCRTGRIRIKRG